MANWQDVVQKLLAQASDPAATTAEKEAFTDRASYLMTKYGIDEHMVRMQNGDASVKPIVVQIPMGNPFKTHKSMLLRGIAVALGTRPINVGGEFHIVGLPDDVARVEMLYHFLLAQGLIGVGQAYAAKPPWEHGKSFKHSWFLGFVTTVVRRVKHAANRATSEAQASAPGTDLVLADRKNLLEAEVTRLYGKLTFRRTTTPVKSRSGQALGMEAGNRADIGHVRLGGSRRALGA